MIRTLPTILTCLCTALPGCTYSSQPVRHLDTFDLSVHPSVAAVPGPLPCANPRSIWLREVRIDAPISASHETVEQFIAEEFGESVANCAGLIHSNSSHADFEVTIALVEWDRSRSSESKSAGVMVYQDRSRRQGVITLDFAVARRSHPGAAAHIVRSAALSDETRRIDAPGYSSDGVVSRVSEGEALRALCRESVVAIQTLVCSATPGDRS